MMIRALLILLAAAVALTACDRRGSLELPSQPETAASPAVLQPADPPGEALLPDLQSPGAQVATEARPVNVPERRFILDPLL